MSLALPLPSPHPLGVMTGSLWAVLSVFPANYHHSPRLSVACISPGPGCSLAEHLMVDSAIIISHPSANNRYCLLASLFTRSTVMKMVFFPCFPWGSLFYRPAFNLARLYSVPENYSSFTDFQHKKKKKVFFSHTNQTVRPKPYWSQPPLFLGKQTFQSHLKTFAFFYTYSI